MNISTLSVRRPVTILMVTLIVVILGFVSLTRLPIDLYPDFEIPVAIVSTNYEGAGPQEVENLVTARIEEAVGTVQNIETIQSISSEGNSLVIIQFAFGTDMNFAALDIREKVDFVAPFLPDDATNPLILKIDPNAQSIVDLSIYANDLALTQSVAQDEIKPRLERLEGVASVNLSGGYTPEIKIELKSEYVHGYGLDINQIAQMLRIENLNLPGGTVKKGERTLTVRTLGEFSTIDEIANLYLTLSSGESIKLRDVADITFGYKDVTSLVKTNGKEAINLSIQKESGVNTVQVAERILTEVSEIQADFPQYELDVVTDQSRFIKASITNVVSSAGYGAVLAVLVLYLFLRNIRTTVIIGISIPVSIIATFVLLFYMNITLNLMTLGGLALGIGMLVDNSIVVLENIYRFRQMGHSKKDAAINGAKEVAMAVTASTLTTVAVFLPISFVEGITSTIFRELALTVAFSLGASLIVSLTVIPMLSSKILKVDAQMGSEHHGKSRIFDWFYNSFDKAFSGLEHLYKKILRWAIHHKKTSLLIAFLTFVTSMVSIFGIGQEFFPALDQGEFSISVNLALGSDLEETNTVVTTIEKYLKEQPDIESVYSTVGSDGNAFLQTNATNTASVRIKLIPLTERMMTTTDLADQTRKFLRTLPGVDAKVNVISMGFGGMSQAPVNINIKGTNLEVLASIGEDIKALVQTVDGTREVEVSTGEGIEEILVHVTRNKAAYHGLNASGIANAVKTAIAGQTATTLKLDGDEIDVTIVGDPLYKESITGFGSLPINTPYGYTVPLSEIAIIEVKEGPTSINRDNQSRFVSVTSQILNRDLGSIVTDIEAVLETYELPDNYYVTIGGENEEMIDAFKDLLLALILAIIIVYMVLASQFESLIHPFTIILTVPLSFSGALFGLFITGRTLSTPSFIGMIMLAGIVVNNAIVLVDYINTRRMAGESRDQAIEEAGPIRLRPILMTTLTTVLGLMPLALGIGEGAESQAPLATAVISGLLLSTLLTLVLVPVVYATFDEWRVKFNVRFNHEGVHD
ncbi:MULTISPECIES: efflux RND transporter permease subunit [unclassified Fusibacter]|uniref:efflux RND transporter permease subunit n=1 Tax=unclassified Fusibacter TaxID=2624464 RepID=UPI001012B6AD|nr:efflux RND transporter permease subunit [Fusibacter sp. A1]MCK8059583.1 efflux RND transporter permease subunit [Fusibacter sp. A2]NPE21384.1 efflux RND transporter permease subunit [Fusibacter sp. A1]RXV61800.1 AcrB/AcrD/AcrF family protein [Fusibacter sp. A1]